jgi:tRNA A-37 threonylcarbamoyl transferase component Bud32
VIGVVVQQAFMELVWVTHSRELGEEIIKFHREGIAHRNIWNRTNDVATSKQIRRFIGLGTEQAHFENI